MLFCYIKLGIPFSGNRPQHGEIVVWGKLGAGELSQETGCPSVWLIGPPAAGSRLLILFPLLPGPGPSTTGWRRRNMS